ncbi:4Fe-4S binding protein [Candidatus Woesearchaeota archaeon]|nr:4Fe-4S binding protein [Candidatus Woesearchaeota archaeon]
MRIPKKQAVALLIGVLAIAAFSWYIMQWRVRRNLGFYTTPSYIIPVLIGVGIGILIVAAWRWRFAKKAARLLRYPAFILFLPIALFPVIRCYFRVPYLFCRVCPSPCPWGLAAKAAVPGFFLMNLRHRFWCHNLCPWGTLQDHQGLSCTAKLRMPKWISLVRWLSLLFAILAVANAFLLFWPGLTNAFFEGNYHWHAGTLIASIILFLLAFLVPRIFCNYLCPIGSLSDLILWLEGWLLKESIKK